MKGAKYYIIGGVLLLAAVGGWFYVQFKMAMDYTLDFAKDKIKINKVTLDQVSIEAVALITNKSELSIHLQSLKTNVYLNGIFLTVINNIYEKTIPPKSSIELPLTINVSPKSLLSIDHLKKMANDLILNGLGTMKVTFKGDISLKTSGVEVKNFPYEVAYTVNELRG